EVLTELSNADLFGVHIAYPVYTIAYFEPQPQFDNSLNPRPLRIIGTHFSARVALVFACFAEETPGVSVANADLRTALSSSLLCNSSGIRGSDGLFRSIFVPDFSNSMAS